MNAKLKDKRYCLRFGILPGQIRAKPKLVEDGAWFDQEGDYIGFGDLTFNDIYRIAMELGDQEAFIVIEGADGITSSDLNDLAEKCTFIILKGCWFSVGENEQMINRKQARVIIRFL